LRRLSSALFTASCDLTIGDLTAKLRALPAARWRLDQISENEYDAAVARNRSQLPAPE